ncbi:MAG: DNA integrity scanning protein DisA nucleotide-binding domain protein [Fidelibacterota bacterium]
MFEKICTGKRGVNLEVLRSTIELAVEIAREGREGRKVGTMFIMGDEENVLSNSRPLILDPLQGHSERLKQIINPDMRETIKELSKLDGAFIVSNEGVVLSAARYINAHSKKVKLPLGLGSRHMAAASVTKETGAVAIVVSESSVVRIFDDGELIAEVIPELWLLSRQSSHITRPLVEEMEEENIAVISKK